MITAATFQGYKQIGADQYAVVVELTDAARSPSVYQETITVSGSTLTDLTNHARRKIAALNESNTTRDLLAGIAVGTPIAVTAPAPAAPPAPSAAAVWAEKAQRLARAKAMGTLPNGALATEIAALQADVVATYAAGHLLGL
jgi:hypothetical protein